jgi:hypothetical protein
MEKKIMSTNRGSIEHDGPDSSLHGDALAGRCGRPKVQVRIADGKTHVDILDA